MLSAGVDVNARNRDGWPGLYAAMEWNARKETVAVLLACSDIRIDITNSCNGMTGLHTACNRNSVECVRLFLAHPACNKHIVTLVDKKGKTAEMRASTRGNHDCVRMIKEFLDKEKNKENTEQDVPRMMERLRLGDVGVADVNSVRLERMTMAELGDGIEKMTALEPVMEAAKNTFESEHKQEVDKLEAEYQALIENHKIKMNNVLDRQDQEKNSCKKYCLENKNKKQALQAELQQRLDHSPPLLKVPSAPSAPSALFLPPSPASLIPECPICMESMRPPLQIFSCNNGHLICSICKPRMNGIMCHCQEMYMGRATAMEQMVRQILGIM
jgi:hypothetical protein